MEKKKKRQVPHVYALLIGIVVIVGVLLIFWVVLDGFRYARYRRRYLRPGMGRPTVLYYPVFWGRPRPPRPPGRPPRPPRRPSPGGGAFGGSRGGLFGGGSFGGRGDFGGGAFRGGGGRRGGAFRGGGGRRGGGFRGGRR